MLVISRAKNLPVLVVVVESGGFDMGQILRGRSLLEHNPAGGLTLPSRGETSASPPPQHLRAQLANSRRTPSTACGYGYGYGHDPSCGSYCTNTARPQPSIPTGFATHSTLGRQKDQHLVLAVYPTEGLAFFPFTKTHLPQAFFKSSDSREPFFQGLKRETFFDPFTLLKR